MTRVPACRTSEVAEGGVRKITLANRAPVAIYNLAGKFYATDDTCTHGQASLAEGLVEDGLIICPFHLGSFAIDTGEAVGPPCYTALKTYPVSIEGDRVFIDIAE